MATFIQHIFCKHQWDKKTYKSTSRRSNKLYHTNKVIESMLIFMTCKKCGKTKTVELKSNL